MPHQRRPHQKHIFPPLLKTLIITTDVHESLVGIIPDELPWRKYRKGESVGLCVCVGKRASVHPDILSHFSITSVEKQEFRPADGADLIPILQISFILEPTKKERAEVPEFSELFHNLAKSAFKRGKIYDCGEKMTVELEQPLPSRTPFLLFTL